MKKPEEVNYTKFDLLMAKQDRDLILLNGEQPEDKLRFGE